MESLVEEIKEKKELKLLDSDFVGSITKEVLANRKVNLEKKSERKKIIKEVRGILHSVYGVFKKSKFSKREKLLKELTGLDDIETHKKILDLHRSTTERLPYNEFVYNTIFRITGKPEKIMDLGCGLNPLSLPFMGLKKVEYNATELTRKDAEFIQSYLDKIKVTGKALPMDLVSIDKLPNSDVCFLFKLLDTLESLKRNVTETILTKLNTKWAVVSFPLKTIGGRKPISKRRLVWFDRLIKGYTYETFEIPNEIFYVIRLKQ